MSNDDLQKEDVLRTEGDAWYRRNRETIIIGSPLRGQFTRSITVPLPVASKGGRPRVLESDVRDGANRAALMRIAAVQHRLWSLARGRLRRAEREFGTQPAVRYDG
jgi:hypothetical protein